MKSVSIGIAASEFFTVTEQHEHKTVVQFKERLAVENSAQILKQLLRLAAKTRPALLVLDLEKISYLDDYGALVLFEIQQAQENRSSALEIVNPKFEGDLKTVMLDTPDLGKLSVYDLVVKRYEQMRQGPDVFDPFTGPIKDNTGKLQVKDGQRASKGELMSIMYYVDNIVGSIPK